MGKMETEGTDGKGQGTNGSEKAERGGCEPPEQNHAFGEQILKSEQVQIERKTLILTLKRNGRGEYLRMTEQAGCHSNTIILPASGLRELIKVLEEMARRLEG